MAHPCLLIIYTGGTLGMCSGDQGLTPSGNIEARLATAFRQLPLLQQQALPSFEVLSYPQLIDSSSATPKNWSQLAHDIAERQRDYQGFVVIHGTDTLSWTAASLAYQLQGIDRPVILTGSMQPLEAPGSDALENLYWALRCAEQPHVKEVAIYFHGKLLRGVRATKQHSEAVDAFTSPNYPLLGERIGDHVVHYPGRGLADQQRGAPRFELPDYTSVSNGAIVRLVLWPGITAWQLASWLGDPRVKGGILQLWGAGNLPDDPSLLATLAKATGEGKMLVAISQCPQGSVQLGAYAAGKGLLDAGVLSGDDMTPEAVFGKLVHLLAQPIPEEDRRHRFLSSLVGER
ncbi:MULTISPECIES: asparaginase [Halomonadaceae]|jgi:L-asparaginase|uniref:Asparaginase n=1 Tax=Vreelandella janggokensis TaxID=370767 RepID=A0ABT4IZC9_9GAMM|nr:MULTISPECIES: asparaginase [Halomonas]MCZ0928327.1 asparaginase [Halomonas janggokensis]